MKGLSAITYGDGQFVVVARDGGTARSDDGVTWVQHSSGAQSLNGIVYGRGQFVAVGNTCFENNQCVGTIMTSADGANWVPRSRLGESLSAVAYDQGYFLAVGQSGTLLTSVDATNWVSRLSGSLHQLSGVASGNGQFVVVGGGGTILASGSMVSLEMTMAASASGPTLSLFAPIGLNYTIQSSTDLISWHDMTKLSGSPSGKVVLDGLSASAPRTFYRAQSQ
jgi:hypothetical protein